jgi:hypothetical protein
MSPRAEPAGSARATATHRASAAPARGWRAKQPVRVPFRFKRRFKSNPPERTLPCADIECNAPSLVTRRHPRCPAARQSRQPLDAPGSRGAPACLTYADVPRAGSRRAAATSGPSHDRRPTKLRLRPAYHPPRRPPAARLGELTVNSQGRATLASRASWAEARQPPAGAASRRAVLAPAARDGGSAPGRQRRGREDPPEGQVDPGTDGATGPWE